MAQLRIEKYTASHQNEWDRFVENSRNASFLFYRDFMEYHRDRFEDCSFLIYEAQKLRAIVPANRVGAQVFSHQGLTYGGIIFKNFEKVNRVQEISKAFFNHLENLAIEKFVVKLLPSKYNDFQSQAIDYVLFQHQAKLVRRDMNFFVPLQQNLKIHKSKKKVYNKDFIKELAIRKTTDFTDFWEQILSPILNEKYGVNPVHTIDEIHLLAERFPKNIQQYNIYKNEVIIAGMTLFIDEKLKVVKSQYGTANELGRKLKALDFLYLELFEKFKNKGFRYFDLGTTNEGDGTIYNESLTNYKEELGGIPKNLDRYEIQF